MFIRPAVFCNIAVIPKVIISQTFKSPKNVIMSEKSFVYFLFLRLSRPFLDYCPFLFYIGHLFIGANLGQFIYIFLDIHVRIIKTH